MNFIQVYVYIEWLDGFGREKDQFLFTSKLYVKVIKSREKKSISLDLSKRPTWHLLVQSQN